MLPEIKKFLPNGIEGKYFEPFIGGGAVLLDIQPARFVINDINPEVINVYRCIKEDAEQLISLLESFEYESEFFYEIRAWDRGADYDALSRFKKAARILYLNKTCFNGLYRVNSKGYFNVPFGKYKNPDFINAATLRAVHEYLNHSDGEILCGSYKECLAQAQAGDFVYLDPPYDPVSSSASFTSYSKDGFSRKNQEELRDVCRELDEKGIRFLLSNSATDFIKGLYEGFEIHIVKATRSINSSGNKRGKIDEVLVCNYGKE